MNNVIKVNFKKQSKLRRDRLMRKQVRNYFLKQLLLSLLVGIMIGAQVIIIIAAIYGAVQ